MGCTNHGPGPWFPPVFLSVLLICAFPVRAFGDSAAEAPQTVKVRLEGFTFAPALAEDGTPELDENGEPVVLRMPLDESLVTPGDLVLYVITLENPTEERAENLRLDVQVAAELLLDPYSFVGPEGLLVEWADAESPSEFQPIFVEVDGQTVMQADLDTLGALRLTLPELPPAEAFSVEYTVNLR